MKKLILKFIFATFVTFLFIFHSADVSAQNSWCPPVKLTNAHVDKNPKFSSFDGLDNINSWYFLSFERYYGTNSKICVLKMNNYGVLDSAFSVCDSSAKNINPTHGTNTVGGSISNLMIVWQRWNPSGNCYNLCGRFYNSSGGWSGIFLVDTSGSNCTDPYIIWDTGQNFNLVYAKNNDIYLKKIQGQSGSILTDTNLTSSDTNQCRNPKLAKLQYQYTLLTYERRNLANSGWSVAGRKRINNGAWSDPVQISENYESVNLGFALGSNYSFYVYYREIYITNYWNRIKSGEYILSTNAVNRASVIDTFDVNLNLSRIYDYWIIDKKSTYGESGTIYTVDKSDGVYIRFIGADGYVKQNKYLGAVASNYSFALSNKFPPVTVLPPYAGVCTFWGVYNKDSAGYSNLWGSYATKTLYVENIKKLDTGIPDEYALYQNYPNPFNPSTKIRFSIPGNGKLKTENGVISLKVYDVLGKEISVLVNEQLQPGTYEVNFETGNIPSGIYFYQLAVDGERFAAKKMLIVK